MFLLSLFLKKATIVTTGVTPLGDAGVGVVGF